MNYIESNKLIAEWIGVDLNFSETVYKDSRSELRHFIDNRLKSDGLLFHTSWDWLMPVGKKIMEYLNGIDRPNKDAVCYGDALEVDIHCAIREYDLPKAHEAICNFITWYNQNNQCK